LIELLSEFTGASGRKGYDVVREYRRTQLPGGDFEETWKTSLHNGFIAGTTLSPVLPVTLNLPAGSSDKGEGDGLEIQFRPDPSVWDGSFANNGWLQELPRPVTKLTWDNAALVSPATADRIGVATEDIVEISLNGKNIEIAAMVVPGHADNVVTLHLGYGRKFHGRVGDGIGVNVNQLRTTAAPWHAGGATLQKTGRRHPLAVTQDHHSMEGREIVRVADVDEFHEHPDFAKHLTHVPTDKETLYPAYEYDSYAWGMSIDLNACTGCNVCTIACQSENNIPIVGKEEVLNAREMHWIRVDRYFQGEKEDPGIYSQPVPCMHCENAPCEVVCPVAATSHDHEGLNVMTYNRCVGTRYCSNNCPYKVRRFNFLQYSDTETESLKLMTNPDVTVRNRGVMEKCTYCVQRISAARITAKKEGREIRDGEVVTACQSACPSQAIIFGDINNKESRVAGVKADPRDYSLLAELNTKPRTSYMARLRNPNPDLKGQE
jgi:molybdopterin-containing oxidoreductase family iron-sulfur binding subunit